MLPGSIEASLLHKPRKLQQIFLHTSICYVLQGISYLSQHNCAVGRTGHNIKEILLFCGSSAGFRNVVIFISILLFYVITSFVSNKSGEFI